MTRISQNKNSLLQPSTKGTSQGLSPKLIQKQRAMMLSQETKRDIATPPCEIKLHPNDVIFKPLDCAGTGKHDVILAMLKLLENNNPYEWIEGDIGCPGGTTPLHLSTLEQHADDIVHERKTKNGINRPIHRYIDFCKDTQVQPSRRQGSYPLTVRELARDMIVKIHHKYFQDRRGNCPDALVAFFDVERHCSALRLIQRLKRGKDQKHSLP